MTFYNLLGKCINFLFNTTYYIYVTLRLNVIVNFFEDIYNTYSDAFWQYTGIMVSVTLVILVAFSILWISSIFAPSHLKKTLQKPLEFFWNVCLYPIVRPVEIIGFGIYSGFRNFFSYCRKLFFPTHAEIVYKECKKLAHKVEALSDTYATLTDEALKYKTVEFRERLANGETLDDILIEAYATVRETAWRVRREKPFLCQILGSIVLHKGMVAEMATGEGKTLTSTMCIYLNALTGLGVHVVTVNDYLAQRDADSMGRVYKWLGLTVGCVKEDMNTEWKKEVYKCDVVYSTSHELAFDYLRDNMQTNPDLIMQRDFHYAIIDELDKVLLDDADTPLIISGRDEPSLEVCVYADQVAKKFIPEDYEIEAKTRHVHLTEKGFDHLEAILKQDGVLLADETIFSSTHVLLLHHINQALKANMLFTNGVHYVIIDGEIQLIDESTGRIKHNNRYSDGLHQAIEAKEGVEIQEESKTIATITYQKFFNMYDKKSGMTGTAYSESEELLTIYGLHVIRIPTNKPRRRIDLDDRIYLTFEEKLDALLVLVKEAVAKKQPLLIGTGSVEKSEEISEAFDRAGIKHRLLNAKNPTAEAEIIAQAGRLGAVTIAAKMAGRGTDIKLGGNIDFMINNIEEPSEALIDKLKRDVDAEAELVLAAGGLFVIGTERDLNARIDNQLKGRAGRQGDKGKSVFLISLDDPLMMRAANGEMLAKMTRSFGHEYGDVLSDPSMTKTIAYAQQRMEAHSFDARKHVLRYDNIITDQSHHIYAERRNFLHSNNVLDMCIDMLYTYIKTKVDMYMPSDSAITEHSLAILASDLRQNIHYKLDVAKYSTFTSTDELYKAISYEIQCIKYPDEIYEKMSANVATLSDNTEEINEDTLAKQQINMYTKHIVLTTIDDLWTSHLTYIENLKHSIQLRAYGQKDPVNEFKIESFKLFEDMIRKFTIIVIRRVFLEVQDANTNTDNDHATEQEQAYDMNDFFNM